MPSSASLSRSDLTHSASLSSLRVRRFTQCILLTDLLWNVANFQLSPASASRIEFLLTEPAFLSPTLEQMILIRRRNWTWGLLCGGESDRSSENIFEKFSISDVERMLRSSWIFLVHLLFFWSTFSIFEYVSNSFDAIDEQVISSAFISCFNNRRNATPTGI